MLKVPAPYPQVGSFALLIDEEQPAAQQRAELVRIEFRHASSRREIGVATIAFPLRVGSSGTRRVRLDQLIDATPLTLLEENELARVQPHLLGTAVRRNAARTLRAEALRTRQIYSGVLRAELAKLERLQARQQPSTGSLLPRDERAVA